MKCGNPVILVFASVGVASLRGRMAGAADAEMATSAYWLSGPVGAASGNPK